MDYHYVTMVLSNYWTECEQKRINATGMSGMVQGSRQQATEELARRLGISKDFNDNIKEERT